MTSQNSESIFKIFIACLFYVFLSRLICNIFNLSNIYNLFIFPFTFIFYFFTFYLILDKQNIYFQKKQNKLLFYLFLICVISTVLNNLSIFNLLLFIVVSLFPFFLFNIILKLNFQKKQINLLDNLLFLFILTNVVLSNFQYFFLGLRADDVQGMFIGQGLGHHINGVICLIYGGYYIIQNKTKLNALKIIFLIFCFLTVFTSDTKSIFFVIIISFIVLIFIASFNLMFPKSYSFSSNLKYLFLSLSLLIISLGALYVFLEIFNLRQFSHINFDYLKSGFQLKLNIFLFLENRDLFDFLIGSGPAMVSSKVAQLSNLFDRYYELLDLLNFSFSKITKDIFIYSQSNFLTNEKTGSSIFSLFFSQVGIYGEVGVLGWIIYNLLLMNIYKYFNENYLCLAILIITYVMSFIFSWLEESIFITFVFILLLIIKFQRR